MLTDQDWHVGRDGAVYDRGRGGRLVARAASPGAARQLAALPRLARVLKAVGTGAAQCPLCGSTADGGHHDDCDLAAVLADLGLVEKVDAEPETAPDA